MNKFTYTIFLLLIILKLSLNANDIPDRPSPPRLVNDFAHILSNEEIFSLEKKLVDFNTETSTQIAIVIVNDLQGYDRAEYTYSLAEKWGVGQKGKNNGIVIMVKPKTPASAGQAFIATGYGLEAVVPDAVAKRIVEYEMIPEFKINNYYAGLNSATDVLISLTKGEFTAEAYNKKPGIDKVPSFITIITIIFFIVLYSIIFGRYRTRRQHSVGRSVPFWIALSMLGSLHKSSGGSFGSFSSGSGSFGGFGGGSFGGGGAGGSW